MGLRASMTPNRRNLILKIVMIFQFVSCILISMLIFQHKGETESSNKKKSRKIQQKWAVIEVCIEYKDESMSMIKK